jgi:hypothetical protein
MIDQEYIDGTLEELVRNRLLLEGKMMVPNEEIQSLVNQEYNRQVNSAKQIFMSQGDDLIVNTKQQINTNKDIDDLLG